MTLKKKRRNNVDIAKDLIKHERELRESWEAAHEQIDENRHKEIDQRLESGNRFREQIQEERVHFLSRELYDREHAALGERVKLLEIVRGEQAGKAAAYASVIGVVVVLIQVIMHFWK